MKPKSKISQRELWLLSLLPAALVLIVSLGLPGPAAEIAETETRLARVTGADAQQRMAGQLSDASKELRESRAQIEQLEVREAELRSRLEELQRPRNRTLGGLDMADALDELTERLARHGVRVLAMHSEDAARSGATRTTSARSRRRRAGTSAAAARSYAGASTSRRATSWEVSVAATWPSLRAALADLEAFPGGLWLSALAMEPAQPNSSLHRWDLIVTEAGAP